jgi:hypothetical protein
LFPALQAPAADAPVALQALRAIGATVARSDSLWEATEVQPTAGGVHTYDPTASLTLASVANDETVDEATLGVPLYVNEWGWTSVRWNWQGASEPARDAAIEQVTEQLGRDPSVADVEPHCWD